VGQVRGVIGERVVFSSHLDPFLTIRAASAYASLKPKSLLAAIRHPDPAQRLPAFRIGAPYLVRRSELDAWILRHRVTGPDLGALVEDVVRGITRPASR